MTSCLSVSQKGIYEVCLTVSNENSSHESCQTLNIGTTSTEQVDLEKITSHVFPNPTNGIFNLSLYNYLPQHAVLYIYNSNGALVYDNRVMHGINQIDISHLGVGTFVYKVLDNGKVVDVWRVVKI